MFQAEPIGVFHSIHQEKYVVPHQPLQDLANEGVIILKPHQEFEQALEGLEEFDRIWVIFWFHLNQHWKPKVMPPRGLKKRGVFATRSPHRPNFIGLSCVELRSIKGLKLFIAHHDLIDGTPILDIKPYLNYADSHLAKNQGWLEHLKEEVPFEIHWTQLAQEQADYLKEFAQIDIHPIVHMRLKINPYPYPNKRIKAKEDHLYELAYKSWRILYQVESCSNSLQILKVSSGYDIETLEGRKNSRWPDVAIHLAFNRQFFL